MKRIAIGGATAALAIGAAVGGTAFAAPEDGAKEAGAAGTYELTIENRTSGQPLSPPVLVNHNKRFSLWAPRQLATNAVAVVAEDANLPIAVSALNKARGVKNAAPGVDKGASEPAPIPPGESQTYVIKGGKNTYLSLVSMLVNTNDTFTGVRNVKLGRGNMKMYMGRAYDAGTEKNNQLASHIPGPVGGNANVHDYEGNVIRRSRGLTPGVGDIPVDQVNWSGPVAKITLKRV
jgi:hypothetical protein